MNTNIQGDFQICISVPLTEQLQNLTNTKINNIDFYLKDAKMFYLVCMDTELEMSILVEF